MSGFEIIGVILGGLPLCIEAAKASKPIYNAIETWWNFDRRFTELVNDIRGEILIFSQNITLLIKRLGITEREQKTLWTSQQFWSHADINTKIKDHLADAVPHVQALLEQLQGHFSALFAILPIYNNQVVLPSPGSSEFEVLRRHFSFSHQRDEIFKKIRNINKQLGIIFRNANDIQEINFKNRSQSVQSPTDLSSFSNLQRESSVFYKTLKAQLNCSCHLTHTCGISTQWNGPNFDIDSICLNFLVGNSIPIKQFKCKMEAVHRKEIGAPLEAEQQPDKVVLINQLGQEMKQQKRKEDGLKAMKKRSPATLAHQTLSLVTGLTNRKSKNTQPNQTTQCITDICHFIQKPPPLDVQFLGTIEALDHDLHLILEPRYQMTLLESQTETIDEFLSKTPKPGTRLRIGFSVAVIILALGTSAWVPIAWSRDDIIMKRYHVAQSEDLTFGPYIQHSSLSFTLAETPLQVKYYSEMTIFSLGVLLLELFYRKPLEKSPYWARYCEDGRPNESTELRAALAWNQDLAKDPVLRDGLAEPVRRCLQLSFKSRPDLGSSDFLQDVFGTVIEPLEKFIDDFEGRY
ncbi:hypothetical protein FSHL1_012464 [Fusarium sambucinum]